MTALPDHTTPDELAREMGLSPRRVRARARDLGACRIFGNRMVLLPEDVTAIMEASRPCHLKSTSAAKSGITGGPLPDGSYEAHKGSEQGNCPANCRRHRRAAVARSSQWTGGHADVCAGLDALPACWQV